MGKLAFSEGIFFPLSRTRSVWVTVTRNAEGMEDRGFLGGTGCGILGTWIQESLDFNLFSTWPQGTFLSSCCSACSPADGGVSPGPHSRPRAEPALPPAHRRWLNQGSVPRPARAGAADVEPGSQVLLRTAGSLATASIIRSRWCSHGVMDITHDSLRQSRNSLVAQGPLCTK